MTGPALPVRATGSHGATLPVALAVPVPGAGGGGPGGPRAVTTHEVRVRLGLQVGLAVDAGPPAEQ